jgi:hypothetical protein
MANNLPNNPTLGDMKEFMNSIVNSITTSSVDEQNETLILNKKVIISTTVEEN